MPSLFTTPKTTHLVDRLTGYTACGRRTSRLTGYSGEHLAGPLLGATDCGSCRRTEFARDLAELWNIKRARDDKRLPEARAYVTSRFYPPLPATYGELAVQALLAYEDGYPSRRIYLHDLPVTPRGAVDGTITAESLIVALRLEHLIDAD